MLGRIMRATRPPSAAGGDPIAALPEGAGLAWMALAATAYLALTTALLRRWPLPLPFARRGG